MKTQKTFNLLVPLRSKRSTPTTPKTPIPDYVGKIGGPLGKPTQKLINALADKAIKKRQGV